MKNRILAISLYFCAIMPALALDVGDISSFMNSDSSTLSLIVNNVLNSRPPSDPSWDGSQGFAPPYYNVFAYNGYGRSYWLEYKIDFGKKL